LHVPLPKHGLISPILNDVKLRSSISKA